MWPVRVIHVPLPMYSVLYSWKWTAYEPSALLILLLIYPPVFRSSSSEHNVSEPPLSNLLSLISPWSYNGRSVHTHGSSSSSRSDVYRCVRGGGLFSTRLPHFEGAISGRSPPRSVVRFYSSVELTPQKTPTSFAACSGTIRRHRRNRTNVNKELATEESAGSSNGDQRAGRLLDISVAKEENRMRKREFYRHAVPMYRRHATLERWLSVAFFSQRVLSLADRHW